MPRPKLSQEENRLNDFKECHGLAKSASYGTGSHVDQERRLQARDFLINAMKPRSWENHYYRANASTYNTEEALLGSLDAFDNSENPVRVYHLKQVRRFLFRRFNFSGACAVNRRLRKNTANTSKTGSPDQGTERESWLWLYKDCILPRMAFSIALGFGAVFGSGVLKTWLDPLARHHPEIAWPAIGLLLLLDFFLIHLNVRNQIGKIPARWFRSVTTCLGCLVWIFLFLQIGNSYDKLIPSTWGFWWSTGWLVGSLALLLGLLGQFFFGKTGSIADPL